MELSPFSVSLFLFLTRTTLCVCLNIQATRPLHVENELATIDLVKSQSNNRKILRVQGKPCFHVVDLKSNKQWCAMNITVGYNLYHYHIIFTLRTLLMRLLTKL